MDPHRDDESAEREITAMLAPIARVVIEHFSNLLRREIGNATSEALAKISGQIDAPRTGAPRARVPRYVPENVGAAKDEAEARVAEADAKLAEIEAKLTRARAATAELEARMAAIAPVSASLAESAPVSAPVPAVASSEARERRVRLRCGYSLAALHPGVPCRAGDGIACTYPEAFVDSDIFAAARADPADYVERVAAAGREDIVAAFRALPLESMAGYSVFAAQTIALLRARGLLPRDDLTSDEAGSIKSSSLASDLDDE